MEAIRKYAAKLDELEPNQVVRKRDGHRYFGLRRTALDGAIARGTIPAPVLLTPGGRARGWFGWQILEHQRRLAESADKKTD